MNPNVAASRQSAANPTPARLRRSTETPLRFMAPMRVHCWSSQLPMNVISVRINPVMLARCDARERKPVTHSD